MCRNGGQDMKSIAFYAVQVLTGLAAFAAGYAMLAGISLMVQPFEVMGLGQGFRSAVGSLEIIAGLFLLFPRSGPIGAVLLASLMIGTLGASLGHVAGQRADALPLTAVHAKQGWDI